MVKKLFLFLLVCGFCAISGTTLGQTYKWVDEKGTVHFSDDPSVFNRSKENQTSKENAIETIKKSEHQKLLNFKPKYIFQRSESEIFEEEMSKAIKEAREQDEKVLGGNKDSQSKVEKLIKDAQKEKTRQRKDNSPQVHKNNPGAIVRIPTQIGHPFRFKPATYSDPIRPGVPKQTGHPLTEVSDAG